MNKFLMFFMFCLLIAGCSSNEKAQTDVEAQAATVYPETDPTYQYKRAVSMVQTSPELTDTQKKQLVGVIDDYAAKSQKTKKEQSQYRAVLVNGMLESKGSPTAEVDLAKKNLQRIDKENFKNLEKFIRDFQFYTGENAAAHHEIMYQAMGTR